MAKRESYLRSWQIKSLENLRVGEPTGILQTSISSNLRILKSKSEYVSGINKRKNREGLFEYQMIPVEGHSQDYGLFLTPLTIEHR